MSIEEGASNVAPKRPLVSCLMLSTGRVQPAMGAIEDFLAQTWDNKELVIVAVNAVRALQTHLQARPDSRIRYVHIESDTISMGGQRNLALSLARGDYIALWHECAHHSPHRLTASLNALLQAQAQALFLGQIQIWQAQQGCHAWFGQRPWQDSLVAQKSHVPAFPDTQHEDPDTWCAALIAKTRAISMDADSLYKIQLDDIDPQDGALLQRMAAAQDKHTVGGIDHWAQTRAWQQRNTPTPTMGVVHAPAGHMQRHEVRCLITHDVSTPRTSLVLRTDAVQQWQHVQPPLVSCLMVTRGQLMPAKFAVSSFLQQTWPNRELVVVVDNKSNELATWLGTLGDPRIRVLASPQGMTLGTRRNQSVDAAQGEFVMIWDDDDLYDADRITACMAVAHMCQVDVVLLERLLEWMPHTKRLFATARRPWEGSMLARKSCMLPYPDVSIQEDTPVTQRMLDTHRTALLDWPELYVYAVTGVNTWHAAHFEQHWLDGTCHIGEAMYDEALAQLSSRLPMPAYEQALMQHRPA